MNTAPISQKAPTPKIQTKGASDENFPVGSFLIPKALRPHVMCYYNFAREIDDIADNPASSPEDKISGLEAFGQALTQGSDDLHFETADKPVSYTHLTLPTKA